MSALAVAAGRDPGTARPDPGGLSPITEVAIRLTGAAHSKREGFAAASDLKTAGSSSGQRLQEAHQIPARNGRLLLGQHAGQQLFQTRRLVLGAFELSEMMEKRPAPSVPCVESF